MRHSLHLFYIVFVDTILNSDSFSLRLKLHSAAAATHGECVIHTSYHEHVYNPCRLNINNRHRLCMHEIGVRIIRTLHFFSFFVFPFVSRILIHSLI